MSHLPLDARSILEYLNELGYRNISAQQLKEFLKDLRKLIKHEEKLGINANQNALFENLYKRTTASYRAKVDKENDQRWQTEELVGSRTLRRERDNEGVADRARRHDPGNEGVVDRARRHDPGNEGAVSRARRHDPGNEGAVSRARRHDPGNEGGARGDVQQPGEMNSYPSVLEDLHPYPSEGTNFQIVDDSDDRQRRNQHRTRHRDNNKRKSTRHSTKQHSPRRLNTGERSSSSIEEEEIKITKEVLVIDTPDATAISRSSTTMLPSSKRQVGTTDSSLTFDKIKSCSCNVRYCIHTAQGCSSSSHSQRTKLDDKIKRTLKSVSDIPANWHAHPKATRERRTGSGNRYRLNNERSPQKTGYRSSCSRDKSRTARSGRTTSVILPTFLPPPKSRPHDHFSSDPVELYQYYQREWHHFRKQIPGENSHAQLRWQIRHKLLTPKF